MYKYYGYKWSSRYLCLGLCSIALLSASAVQADAYLEMLEAEVSAGGANTPKEAPKAAPKRDTAVNIDDAADYVDPSTVKRSKPKSRKHLEAGLDRRNFERDLEDRFIGVYRRYEKLHHEDQEEVYADYLEDNSIGSVRKTILHLKLQSIASGRQASN